MGRKLGAFSLACFLCLAGSSYGQGQTATPFLIIPTSVEGNGMGGIAASLVTNDAISTISNPAQLGFFGLDNDLSLSTYSPKTTWLPGSNVRNLSLNVTALSAGLQLNRYFKLPAAISLGVGYSQTYFDYGTFTTSIPNTSVITSQFHAYDKADNITFGIGIDYVVKLGIGYNFKWIDSNLGPTTPSQLGGPMEAKVPAHDFGMILQIPVINVASHFRNKPIALNDKVSPLFDLTFGYASRNVGGRISYGTQSDPLPRQAALGWNFEVGLLSQVNHNPWKLLTFTWAREATDVLVSSSSIATVPAPGDTTYASPFSYRSGLGDIRPIDNLLLGRTYGTIDLMKGWQVQLAECLYFREGSYTGVGGLLYKTHGDGFRMNGFLKLLASLGIWNPEYGWGAYFLNHFDLQYNTSTYTSTQNSLINGTEFSSVNIVFK
ncbi:MAG: hypothetical protein M1469_10260 [Bacteroidetes bacterium]|nr:hypothetical protein [Bacteroidota bacterium]